MKNGEDNMLKEQLELYGDVSLYSQGLASIMADLQIKKCLDAGLITVSKSGDGREIVCDNKTKKWFIHSGGYGNNTVYSWLLGAAAGDISGSIYEHHNIKRKIGENMLCTPYCHFTDDTVMTCAVAKGIMNGIGGMNDDWYRIEANRKKVREKIQQSVREYGRRYPSAGYGGRFMQWLMTPNPSPYRSWGNGSAMRASYAGWAAKSLEEAEVLAELSAEITHNHTDGINGAKAVAGAIFLLKKGGTKKDVKEYVSGYYKLDFKLDDIRAGYEFDVSCKGSVPQAVTAFLEGNNFAEVLSNAISIGGDSDTIAAIAGSIAEVIYPMSQELRGRVVDKLDSFLLRTIVSADDFVFFRFADL